MKKNFPLIIIILIGIFAAYLMTSNASLKASITETQDADNDRIEELEKKLDALTQPQQDPVDIQVSKAAETPQFMDEDALLDSFFAGNPSPIITEIDSSEDSKSGPVLTVDPEVFDLGTISKQDGLATATFNLLNEGGSDLTISYAFTSCGCTVAPLKEEKVLKPGESYPLDVSYDPNFYGPNFELGYIEKTVTILSNYSAKPFYKVKLKANVTP